MNSLPEILLENILLRLTLVPLLQAKHVCREWKRLVKSSSFKRSYSSTVEVVETRTTTNTLVTFDNTKLDLGDLYLGHSCPKTGLMVAYTKKKINSVYVFNMFNKKVTEIALRESINCGLPIVSIFGLGDGRYKLVFWEYFGWIFTLESGQQGWMTQWVPDTKVNLPAPGIVMGNSTFRLDTLKGRLMEYNILGEGKVTAVPITSKEEVKLDVSKMQEIREFIVWESRLYLMLLFARERNLELWEISTSDGVAALIISYRVSSGLVSFDHAVIEDDKLLVHFYKEKHHYKLVVCDMITKSVETQTLSPNESLQISRTVPIRLWGF